MSTINAPFPVFSGEISGNPGNASMDANEELQLAEQEFRLHMASEVWVLFYNTSNVSGDIEFRAGAGGVGSGPESWKTLPTSTESEQPGDIALPLRLLTTETGGLFSIRLGVKALSGTTAFGNLSARFLVVPRG